MGPNKSELTSEPWILMCGVIGFGFGKSFNKGHIAHWWGPKPPHSWLILLIWGDRFSLRPPTCEAIYWHGI